ncbi:MAG: Fe-S cluster assembly protein SufD, partial [Pseudomonadota bacterium]
MPTPSLRRIEPDHGYAALFDTLKGSLPGSTTARAANFERFTTLGFPTTRTEAWKYTNLKPLAEAAPLAPRASKVSLADLDGYLLDGDVRRLVFVNGHLAADLSDVARLPAGLEIKTLAECIDDEAALLADVDAERSLTALNAALATGGAVIDVAAGARIAPVIQLVFVDAGEDAAMLTNLRNRVLVGAEACLRMAET